MSCIQRNTFAGVPVLRLVGDLGPERAEDLVSAMAHALGETRGPVVLDLAATEHLHLRLAQFLATTSSAVGRLVLACPSPYVNRILQLAGVTEQDVRCYGDMGEALTEAVA